MGWTDERVESLKKLWQDGLSASQIANRLGGVSRNAVIGKVHRLGLSGRATPSTPRRVGGDSPAKPAPRAPRPVTKFQGDGSGQVLTLPKVKPLPALRTVDLVCEPVSFADREAHQCAYILDGDGPPMCCGLRVAGRGPYCAEHAGLASNGQGRDLNPDYYANLGNRRAGRGYAREERVFCFPGSPSDRRSVLNQVADLRKVLRAMGAEVAA